MTRYAIEKDGYAIDVILTDSATTAQLIATQKNAVARLLSEGETPNFKPPDPLPNYILTRFDFIKRIGRTNRKAIRASTIDDVIDSWDLIKSADLIDVRDDQVIQAVDAWKAANIINNNRRNEILAPT